jgi:hypothetical protein
MDPAQKGSCWKELSATELEKQRFEDRERERNHGRCEDNTTGGIPVLLKYLPTVMYCLGFIVVAAGLAWNRRRAPAQVSAVTLARINRNL